VLGFNSGVSIRKIYLKFEIINFFLRITVSRALSLHLTPAPPSYSPTLFSSREYCE